MKYKQKYCLVGYILEVSHKGGAQPFAVLLSNLQAGALV